MRRKIHCICKVRKLVSIVTEQPTTVYCHCVSKPIPTCQNFCDMQKKSINNYEIKLIVNSNVDKVHTTQFTRMFPHTLISEFHLTPLKDLHHPFRLHHPRRF